MLFHENLKKLLEDRGMTGVQLHALVGEEVSRSTVYNWINGKSTPEIKYVNMIANKLGSSFLDLFPTFEDSFVGPTGVDDHGLSIHDYDLCFMAGHAASLDKHRKLLNNVSSLMESHGLTFDDLPREIRQEVEKIYKPGWNNEFDVFLARDVAAWLGIGLEELLRITEPTQERPPASDSLVESQLKEGVDPSGTTQSPVYEFVRLDDGKFRLIKGSDFVPSGLDYESHVVVDTFKALGLTLPEAIRRLSCSPKS